MTTAKPVIPEIPNIEPAPASPAPTISNPSPAPATPQPTEGARIPGGVVVAAAAGLVICLGLFFLNRKKENPEIPAPAEPAKRPESKESSFIGFGVHPAPLFGGK